MPFALAARRQPALLNPMIAMFAVFPEARRRDVEPARDLGVHDVICRPISPKTIDEEAARCAGRAPALYRRARAFSAPIAAPRRAPAVDGAGRRSRVAKKTKIAVDADLKPAFGCPRASRARCRCAP